MDGAASNRPIPDAAPALFDTTYACARYLTHSECSLALPLSLGKACGAMHLVHSSPRPGFVLFALVGLLICFVAAVAAGRDVLAAAVFAGALKLLVSWPSQTNRTESVQ